ncbi:chromosomal replication initiator protein DnaA [Candidatus Acetothermia bacterium]|jgi:chromosomal replication initiator protein|nr:chromosomal replication initiator protein DnaA [Candidatus Acetothermia bacterium]MCI2431230.1 chromosomal replication initiator protein DnaA [Candidatus Acetothermia bacterium]MCI2436843.1 chromosomal replication initiator protein DnaA [Candidatus Acetothermia bacterium]
MRTGAEFKESWAPVTAPTLCEDYTFARFVRGENNRLAYAASLAVAEHPAHAYNPLYIYSAPGLGKTHLLHAIGNGALQQHRFLHIIYSTCERLATEFYRAIQENKTAQFRKIYRSADLLLLDDVHFLREKAALQEELCHTFNELHQRGKQIVLASDRSPEALPQLQEQLVSRFRWGLVADIQPPPFEARLAILRAKAQDHNLDIPEAILELIAQRVRTNVRALEGALIRLAASAALHSQEITSQLVFELLPAEVERPLVLDVATVKREIARHYQLRTEDLESESRERRVAQARQLAIYLARELTESSFPALGAAFGGRDHSTIMYAYRKAKALAESPLFRSEIDALREYLLKLAAPAYPK